MQDEVRELLVEQLKDAYSAEKQGLRAMPRVAKKATSQALKEAFQMHAEQTEHHAVVNTTDLQEAVRRVSLVLDRSAPLRFS